MIHYLYLGRVGYGDALKLQNELVELRRDHRIGNVLLLLEHPPVLTLGRNADRSNILASDELLARSGVTIHEINRGGDVTYHGPGQLVGYPIFDLRSLKNASGGRLGPVDFVRMIEEALIRLCGVYGVRAGRIAGLTGVWCPPRWGRTLDKSCERSAKDKPAGERKIGAIGIHVSRGITSHGFAFNVTTDLGDFQLINPCGITDRPVTSLAREVADAAALPALESIAHQAARQFGNVFGEQVLAVEDLAALRGQAAAAPAAQVELAAPKAQLAPPQVAPPQGPEDTPLQIPREVGRLHGEAERPVRA
jgi:lipoyl(octanoyl) transferase